MRLTSVFEFPLREFCNKHVSCTKPISPPSFKKEIQRTFKGKCLYSLSPFCPSAPITSTSALKLLLILVVSNLSLPPKTPLFSTLSPFPADLIPPCNPQDEHRVRAQGPVVDEGHGDAASERCEREERVHMGRGGEGEGGAVCYGVFRGHV